MIHLNKQLSGAILSTALAENDKKIRKLHFYATENVEMERII
jgi:hypothetical protein